MLETQLVGGQYIFSGMWWQKRLDEKVKLRSQIFLLCSKELMGDRCKLWAQVCELECLLVILGKLSLLSLFPFTSLYNVEGLCWHHGYIVNI